MLLTIDFSLISGWFPTVVVVVALVSFFPTIGWRTAAWRWQLLIGLPVSLVLFAVAHYLIDRYHLVQAGLPASFNWWVWALALALALAVIGWHWAHWAMKTTSLFSVVMVVVAGSTVLNQTFDYYPTLQRLLGKEAAHFANVAQLGAMRAEVRKTGHLPDHGATVSIPIPATKSGFHARNAYVWLPPAWFAESQPHLPMIELLIGTPGQPSDWTRAAYADTTSLQFAEQHGGQAPILVMPDPNSTITGDTECVNSKAFGNAATYLTEDVPNYMRVQFDASSSAGALAIAGLSAGGTCATQLALTHPGEYVAFANYSGDADITYQDDDVAQSITTLFGGSTADYDAHNPATLLMHNRYPQLAGWFGAGEQDTVAVAAARQLQPAAHAARIATCILLAPGAHNFAYWTSAFRSSLPWLSWRLGLTPPPTQNPATCQPGAS